MSDFDAALERLCTDPSFAADLAADPDRALAGYTLDAGEAALLRSQVAADACADVAAVETRTTKSSMFGMLSPFAGTGALTEMLGHRLGDGGPAAPVAPLGPWSEFGTAVGGAAQQAAGAVGEPAAVQGMGPGPDAWGAGGGNAAVRTGLGEAPNLDGLPAVSGFGESARTGLGEAQRDAAPAEELAAPKGYHNKVDADGDGEWDRATYRGHRGGGAEILVDANWDGQADFIGYDVDADRTVDYADYDKNHDGIFEKRMYDDDGDGWLDRSKPLET
jgi:hypothetical protein